jgi:hypothetical protein
MRFVPLEMLRLSKPQNIPVRVLTCLLLSIPALSAATVPQPRDVLGFTPGDEHKLANYEEIVSYFERLEKASDRIRLQRFGATSTGKPMVAAFISDPDNLKKLDKYRDISRRLALGLATPAEAQKLAGEGRAIVWIDSGLHASEVAPSQHAPELAYKMITSDTEEIKRIRHQVILIQIPSINPDGLDWVVEWYRHNLGTPYELAPLPRLYQQYAGHDNNRDWFMLNLPETRHVTKLLFQDWFPQIVYNQHQAPPFPARIFIPPYAEPLNPNIPHAVMEEINLIGAAMKERLARNEQPGTLSYWGYDAWWNGGLRSVPAFHNMHGILTETAGFAYGNSKVYNARDFPERFGNGMPTKQPTVFYEQPWMGGKWGVREAIDYMLTADVAILDLAAARSSHFLLKAYEMARANMQASARPYAYVVRPDQSDSSSAREMLRRLAMAGIKVERAAAAFEANGASYPEGSYVLRAAQPFRGYLVDLMEPQRYPELKAGISGPTKPPYDIAGWTLPMQMGVNFDRVDTPFNAPLEDAGEIRPMAPSRDHRDSGFFLTMADLTGRGAKVRWSRDGSLLEPNDSGFNGAAYEMVRPRVAVYEPWTANIDSGWTVWLLDYFKVPHTVLHNGDLRAGGLRAKFDTLIIASQTAQSILHGFRQGERPSSQPGGDVGAQQRPEYTGGIELAGLAELDRFVRDGGTLLAFDQATELPVREFPLPVRLLLRPQPESRDAEIPATGYYCPGSLLRIQVDTSNPLAFGIPKEAFAFSSGGQAFESMLLPQFNAGDREVRTVANYAGSNLLASGWISGERAVMGKAILIEARHGQGSVVLFGFRPQHRGQTFGTFKFVLNAVYLGSAKKL